MPDLSFTHVATMGSTKDGVFTVGNDRSMSDDKKDGSTRGGCKGYGHGTAREPKDMLLLDHQRCAKYRKGLKRKKRYSYIVREPNSKHSGLYVQSNQGSVKKEGDAVVKGQPCPFAESAKWLGALKPGVNDESQLQCVYPKLDETLLLKMSKAMKQGEKKGPRYETWHAGATKFCAVSGNAYKVINRNDETCKTVFKNKGLAAKYCVVGDHMASQPDNCSAVNLTATVYDKLGKAFCKKHPENPWCGCYNVINKTCTTNPGRERDVLH